MFINKPKKEQIQMHHRLKFNLLKTIYNFEHILQQFSALTYEVIDNATTSILPILWSLTLKIKLQTCQMKPPDRKFVEFISVVERLFICLTVLVERIFDTNSVRLHLLLFFFLLHFYETQRKKVNKNCEKPLNMQFLVFTNGESSFILSFGLIRT